MENGWYILNYHDISWEENAHLKGIGGSFSPDIFSAQLKTLSSIGKLVSIQEGIKRYLANDIDQPLISFWFDDGFLGVRKYASPLLKPYGIQGAVSINSNFTLRKEMFWRAKLSYLSQTDGLRFLRSRLRKYGYKTDIPIKDFTLNHFSTDIIKAIDDVYSDFSCKVSRDDAFRIFDSIDGIKELHSNNWVISNHSASHYPVGENSYIDYFKDEFVQCEEALKEYFNIQTKYWVVPFDRKKHRSNSIVDVFTKSDDDNRFMVLVDNKYNNNNKQKNILYRISAPSLVGEGLIKYLNNIPSSVS